MSTVVARAQAAPPSRRPERRAGEARKPLEVVSRRSRRVRRRRLLPVLAACILSGSLFAVVIGHAELAQDQMRLAAVQSAITAAQSAHRREVISVANLENPARIVREAETSLHMQTPSSIVQLPHVTLHAPLSQPAPASPGSSVPSGAAKTSDAAKTSGPGKTTG